MPLPAASMDRPAHAAKREAASRTRCSAHASTASRSIMKESGESASFSHTAGSARRIVTSIDQRLLPAFPMSRPTAQTDPAAISRIKTAPQRAQLRRGRERRDAIRSVIRRTPSDASQPRKTGKKRGAPLTILPLLYMPAGYVCGILTHQYFRDSVPVRAMFTAIAAVLRALWTVFILFATAGNVSLPDVLTHAALPEIAATLLFAALPHAATYLYRLIK